MEALDKCEGIIKVVQQRVHDTAIEFIQEVRTREKQLIEALENIYGKECMERIVNKKSTSSQVQHSLPIGYLFTSISVRLRLYERHAALTRSSYIC